MNRFERIYKIHEMLRTARQPVPMRAFIQALDSSRNSVTRDFEYLRDMLGAPLVYSREHNGHRYDPGAGVFELPGFWMNSGELYALLASEQLLEQVQPGLLGDRLLPLKERIRNLLGESGHSAERISEKIQIQPIQFRVISPAIFDPVAEATLAAQQLRFDYHSRSSVASENRLTHPQRLIHYRSNWYLVAHCEAAQDLRLFSLDRIAAPVVQNVPCQVVVPVDLDHFLGSGFGIFGGQAKSTAHLRFSAQAAKWVAEESWHPEQVGEWRDEGYHLSLPYADSPELVMDILRYAEHVEVLAPAELRTEVAEKIRKMYGIYW
ncbi:MAG: YafY family protein [Pseudohongiella sp.]|uniref:helix-turn-helix transcriptional regulator n=1 Tax=Pseudohongiella sp. TaxID=1979412 RepID=UPI0034A0851A